METPKQEVNDFIKKVYEIIENNQATYEADKKNLVKKEVERRITK